MKKFFVVLLAMSLLLAFAGTALAADGWSVTAGTDTVMSDNNQTAYYEYAATGACYTVSYTITNTGDTTLYYALSADSGVTVGTPSAALAKDASATVRMAVTTPAAAAATYGLYSSADGSTGWSDVAAVNDLTVTPTKATQATFAGATFTNTSGTDFSGTNGDQLVLPVATTTDFTINASGLDSKLDLTYKVGSDAYATAVHSAITTANISVPAINGSKTVTFQVTNEAGEKATKAFTISRPSNAKLSALTVVGKDSGTTYINNPENSLVKTTEGDTKVNLTPTVADPTNYIIKVNGTEVTSGNTYSYTIGNTTSGTSISIVVTNKNNANDSRTYTVKLTMDYAADLDDLIVSLDEDAKDDLVLYRSSALSSSKKGFDDRTYEYWLDWDEIESGDYLYVDASLSRSDAKTFDIDVDSDDKVSGSEPWKVKTTGEDITITVSADGYLDRVYTLNLDGSENGDLKDLEIFNGKDTTSSKYELDLYPKFASATEDYFVFIPYDKSDDEYVTVRATAKNKSDYLKVEGTEKTSSSYDVTATVKVAYGDNEEITVKAGDTTYTVNVYRADKSADDDLGMSTLKLYINSTINSSNETALTSTSTSSSTKKYSATVPTTQTYVWLNTQAKYKTSFVLVDGVMVSEQTTSSKTTKIELNKTGTTTITVLNVAEDCETTEESVITVTKGVSDALLKNLYISGNSGSLNYSPNFSSKQYYYCTNMAYGNSTIYFTPTVNATGSTIKINGTTVTSGQKSTGFSVSVGQSTFDIAVTSTAGTVQHYYVNVLRQAQTPSIQVSSQKLSVNGGTAQALAAYNIDGYNYLKLRDVAKLLSGSTKQFSVGYDDYAKLVTMTTNRAYTAVGGELVIPSKYKAAKVSPQTVKLDGSYVYPMAYNIDGNNYFLMRDLALLLNCDIQYNSSSRVITVNANQSFAN